MLLEFGNEFGKNKFCSSFLVVAVLACRHFLSLERVDFIQMISGFGEIKNTHNSPEPRSTNYERVMFEIDLFGGQKGFPYQVQELLHTLFD